jgi:hypothetical protein
MKSISIASVALFVAGALAQFTINTPSNVVECQPSLISWSGGTAPYYLSVLPGASPNGAAIESFPATNSTSLTWTVNIASGTSIGLTLRDTNGDVAQTAPFSINPGSSDTCLNTTSVVAGPTAASTPAAGTTAGATTGGTPATTGATTGTAAAASPSSTTGAASANTVQFGVAGIVGVAVAALFL